MDTGDHRDGLKGAGAEGLQPAAAGADARPTGIAALRVAKALLGTEAALARAVGVSQPAVHHMLTRGKRVPAEWCLRVEQATGGAVTRHDLRIDIYPAETRCACTAAGEQGDS